MAREDAIRKIDAGNEADKPEARFTANSVGEDCVRLTPNANPAKVNPIYGGYEQRTPSFFLRYTLRFLKP